MPRQKIINRVARLARAEFAHLGDIFVITKVQIKKAAAYLNNVTAMRGVTHNRFTSLLPASLLLHYFFLKQI